MEKTTLPVLIFLFFLFSGKTALSQSQDALVHPSLIRTGVFLGETPPLRDIPPMSSDEIARLKEKAEKEALNKELEYRSYPFAATALPRGPDQAWQNFMGTAGGSRAPIINISGQASPYYPPDCNGATGPDHFMQTINCVYAIYNKTGTLVAGPSNMNTLFSGVTGSSCNDGDPIVLYDEQAGRWLAAEFSICGSNDYMMIAVSTTNDPTGTWYKYSFDVADMPDYPKFGVWQDGYYMGDNNSSGNDIYVFQRSVMLTGGASPQMVGFDNAWRPTTIDGFECVPPVDNDGAFAPAGSPGLFITMNDDAIGGGSDQLWIYELAVNWTTPSSSTFTRSQQINVTPFDSNFGNNWNNITQPNTQKLDAIPQVIMNVPQYRNFGSYQTIVCCHNVDVDATNHAGVRWYELRRVSPATTWTIRQQGTYAPDADSRWMGSVMLNGSNQIGLGYSVSSSNVYPSIRYAGQSAGEYNSATGIIDIAEDVIQTGAYAQTGTNRWGDYSLMSVDPTDDKTFWFTSEYIGSGGTRQTKIASFKFGNSPTAITLAATSITGTTATLNGTINPNGLATTYYFQWGTTISYGNTTISSSAGSGTSNVNVNDNITGLIAGTPYHFRVVGINSDGTTNGNDMTFTPGAATVTTTAASSITTTSAISGGNVTSDGGFTVTARGVCWNTTANPVATGNHTTDGSGVGSFTSSITGLSVNTLYHVRAYAINANGTYYGDDLQFTTLCGTITTFPWNEGFENAGASPNCWTQEQVNNSGVNWTFITGNGSGHPAAAHGGTYNACLIDETSPDNKTRLITPPLNLTSVSSPQLKFWHTQAYWSPDQDQLTVFYKTSTGGTWTQLALYTSNITSWTEETISLPNPTNNYYIAFEGNAKYGYGVCVDDVSVSSSCASFLPVSVSIAASANPVCTGFTVIFTPTPVNGGSPAYQWFKNSIAVGTGSTYSCVPVNGDQVYVIMTSNLSCTSGNPATSNTVTITVNPIPNVTNSPLSKQICSNISTNIVLTSSVSGTTFSWTATGSSPNITGYAPGSGAVIDQILINQGFSTESVTYHITPTANGCNGPITDYVVTIFPVPDVYFIPPSQTICSLQSCSLQILSHVVGASFTWTASGSSINVTGYSGGSGNMIQQTLVNSGTAIETVTYLVTPTANGCPGITSAVIVIVYPLLPVSVSVAPSENPVLEGTSVTFTATPTNGGTTPFYQWKVNGTEVGTNSSTYSYVPVNNDAVLCLLTSNATCPSGNPATSNTVIMIVNPPAMKVLNLNVFLQGLYDIGTGLMRQAMNIGPTPEFGPGIADQVTIELHDATPPYAIASLYPPYTNVNLNTDGTLAITTIPGSITGSYYIVVKHRNSIETWSMTPVAFGGAGPVSYDFTTAASQAYGNNMKLMGTVTVIYGGDASQDGAVDGTDMAAIDNASTALLAGYIPEDVNGDGIADGSDMALIENNSTDLVHVQRP